LAAARVEKFLHFGVRDGGAAKEQRGACDQCEERNER
jgi:hypothetical protein